MPARKMAEVSHTVHGERNARRGDDIGDVRVNVCGQSHAHAAARLVVLWRAVHVGANASRAHDTGVAWETWRVEHSEGDLE